MVQAEAMTPREGAYTTCWPQAALQLGGELCLLTSILTKTSHVAGWPCQCGGGVGCGGGDHCLGGGDHCLGGCAGRQSVFWSPSISGHCRQRSKHPSTASSRKLHMKVQAVPMHSLLDTAVWIVYRPHVHARDELWHGLSSIPSNEDTRAML